MQTWRSPEFSSKVFYLILMVLALINQYFDLYILEIEISYITGWLFKNWMESKILCRLLIIE